MARALLTYNKEGRDEASGWSYRVTLTPSEEYSLPTAYGLHVQSEPLNYVDDDDSCISRYDLQLSGGIVCNQSSRKFLADILSGRGRLPLAACNDVVGLVFAHYGPGGSIHGDAKKIEAHVRVETFVPEEEEWTLVDTHSMLLEEYEDDYEWVLEMLVGDSLIEEMLPSACS